MIDHIEDADTAPEKRKNRKGTPKVAKVVARALWAAQWREANPDGTAEARRAAWKEVREEETKKARGLVRYLERSGVSLTLVAKGRRAAAEAGEDLDQDD